MAAWNQCCSLLSHLRALGLCRLYISGNWGNSWVELPQQNPTESGYCFCLNDFMLDYNFNILGNANYYRHWLVRSPKYSLTLVKTWIWNDYLTNFIPSFEPHFIPYIWSYQQKWIEKCRVWVQRFRIKNQIKPQPFFYPFLIKVK